MDLYVFATPYRVTWDYYFLGREHTLEIDEWDGKEEYEYVSYHYRLFKLKWVNSYSTRPLLYSGSH